MASTKQPETTAEILFYLSGAFKNAVDGRFMELEHAKSLWKKCLIAAGHETSKEKEVAK